jgi:hypothetical protein
MESSFAISFEGLSNIFTFPNETLPTADLRSLDMVFSKVDLPQPLLPTSMVILF